MYLEFYNIEIYHRLYYLKYIFKFKKYVMNYKI